MDWLLAALGVVLIVLVMIDAIWTTLTAAGAGPITMRLADGVWWLAVRDGRPARRHFSLMLLGTAILLMIVATWIVMLWTGWTLLFSADPGAIVNASTREPADLWSRIYFTGYTIFTLGVGNFIPIGGLWEVLTAVASINGLFLITLAITYLLPVISATAQKRQLAAVISDLGRTPAEIVLRAWDGTGFEGLTTHLSQLLPMIELHAQRHAAYPVLHYFHSPTRRTAASPSLAALDEALLLLTAGAHPDVRPPAAAVEPLQHALAGLMATLVDQYIRPADNPPPVPDLDVLSDAGIPVVDPEAFRAAAAEREEHRLLMRAFVEDDGWMWEDVWSTEASE